jgi:hypothetical protein
MGNAFFMWKLKKTLVAKDVGNTKMHISTKNGTMVPKFAVELAQTMVTCVGTPVYHPEFPLCIQFMIPGRPS